MIVKSLFFALITIVITFFVGKIFGTFNFLSDVGGLSAFVSVFGTLFGIMTAFVVFEVWSQYNETVKLINLEAQGLERLFRLTLYFRDDNLNRKMQDAIEHYAEFVIDDKFQTLGLNGRSVESGIRFRKISAIIRDIKFDDDHDSIVYDHIVSQYGDLAETRTKRIDQSLTRLPKLLKVFLYSSSLIALFTFIFMPFSNQYYSFFVSGTLGFIMAMVFQMVEDLDNPFVGEWNVTPEPFERALKHIREDY